MPIRECTLPEGGNGWQWGEHGKCYASREDAEKQAEAAHANGYTGDTMKTRTHDRNLFYLAEQLGEKRSTTPEGFLVCHDVPIARTGTQLYSTVEIPLEGSANGEVRIERTPEEVFRPETLASFEGKPVTVEHPDEFVTPDNWQQLAVGFVQNVRRGEGIEDDLMIADLVITDAAAIEYVNKELPEVSAGYKATYEQTEPGRGVQRDIVGNHVALVKRGRAGPRCSIQDHQKEPDMKAKKLSFLDKLRKFIDSEAEEESKEEKKEEAQDDAGDDKQDSEILARVERIEAVLQKLLGATGDEDKEDDKSDEKKDETGDDDGDDEKEDETTDTVVEAETAGKNSEAVGTVLTGDALRRIHSRAEILAPGIAIQTGDAAGTKDAVAKLQRKALAQAYGTERGKGIVEPFLNGRTIKSLTGDALDSVFAGAAELMRVSNNNAGIRPGVSTKDFGRMVTVSDINARNRDFWANRK